MQLTAQEPLLSANGKTTTTGGGAATFIGADFSIDGAITVGAGNISIAESTSGTTMALGTATGAILTDSEFDNITTNRYPHNWPGYY